MIGLALADKRSLKDDPAKFKRVWAAAVTMTALAFAKDVTPNLVGWFAGAILAGATIVQNNVISDFLTQGTGAKISTTGGKKK